MNKRISDLPILSKPNDTDKVLISHYENGDSFTMAISVYQLLGIQQQALRRICPACGTIGCYDMRGNCGACGHPFES